MRRVRECFTARYDELTIGRSTAEIADEFLTTVDKDTPRIDVASTSLTPRRPGIFKVDDGYDPFFRSELGERLDNESEWELGSGCEIVGVREGVSRHTEEARVAVSWRKRVSEISDEE